MLMNVQFSLGSVNYFSDNFSVLKKKCYVYTHWEVRREFQRRSWELCVWWNYYIELLLSSEIVVLLQGRENPSKTRDKRLYKKYYACRPKEFFFSLLSLLMRTSVTEEGYQRYVSSFVLTIIIISWRQLQI